MANIEKFGKRNTHFSSRHRQYGYMLVMDDLDMVEYDCKTDMPVAVCETKFGLVKDLDLNDNQFTRQLNLANRLEVPYFCVVYYIFGADKKLLNVDDDFKEFTHAQYYVIPVNQAAKAYLPRQAKMTELEYVRMLYTLRGETLAGDLKLCTDWIQNNNFSIPFVLPRPV